ncbi:uncharacterized protein DDB_G0283697 [Teleopsis dalmanni]|uniref:uncharacterized protein DDB_G0283697 n=1 Tax=Teleopsis dalmanni TaxID=139649 RepID=UPI0018CC88F8|nr:uncharacterized protein DDB_G0283697 [Teleopsis dalmanni]
MSTKSLQPNQGRRTPLSIGASVPNNKHHHKQNQGNNKAVSNSNKTESKLVAQPQKSEPISEKKESEQISQKDTKKQQNHQNNNKNHEEKTQNGVGKSNNNGNITTKDKAHSSGNSNHGYLNVRINIEKTDLTSKQQNEEKSVTDEKKENASKKEKTVEKDVKVDKVLPKETTKQKEKDSDSEVAKAETKSTKAVTEVIEKEKVEKKATTEDVVLQKTDKIVSTNPTEKVANATPAKLVEKDSETSKKIKTPTKPDTVTIMDIDSESIIASKPSPVKESPIKVTCGNINKPAATSTPGKMLFSNRLDNASSQAINYSPPRTFGQISGRRSIRTINNIQNYRETYRRINTELDESNCTVNTSLNVTVGSEIPNSSSFSFFGRGRKRDRTPPQHSQSAMEIQIDGELSPPKRARIDMYGLLSVVSSPLSLLRSRFSRASIQTPVKLVSKLDNEENAEVQNLSGNPNEVEKHQGNEEPSGENSEAPVTEIIDDETKENAAKVENEPNISDAEIVLVLDDSKDDKKDDANEENQDNEDHIDIKEISLVDSVGDPVAKSKKCNIM